MVVLFAFLVILLNGKESNFLKKLIMTPLSMIGFEKFIILINFYFGK
ncbi:hypothetical protein LMG9449_2133 [Lactococcus lactis subsp. lactis]|uniref:Uncharacterized protein n=1 Tax=Lactococcus lactis subsp. lactis TaxID=1360 RepID=A0A0V8DEM2_LACLL|nr:hypothetical protein LMG9446_1972 [Lactococcus lactis subsp. lactis]KSU16283.1 hypothetical protein LMG9449_2133 [Lactococcus lactis subsp. lactis]